MEIMQMRGICIPFSSLQLCSRKKATRLVQERNARVKCPNGCRTHPPTTTRHPPIGFDNAHPSEVVVTFLLHGEQPPNQAYRSSGWLAGTEASGIVVSFQLLASCYLLPARHQPDKCTECIPQSAFPYGLIKWNQAIPFFVVVLPHSRCIDTRDPAACPVTNSILRNRSHQSSNSLQREQCQLQPI